MEQDNLDCIAFDGVRCIGLGPLADVAPKVKETSDAHPLARILVFNAVTSEPVEIDCRGSMGDVMNRLAGTTNETLPQEPSVSVAAGRGRPKLGVIAREVTLLPRHWEWLSAQPGGASVALRKLVEQAKRVSSSADRLRQSQNATYQFMAAMAGDLDGFEEASRSLFAADRQHFEARITKWPDDIREHLHRLSESAFQTGVDPELRHSHP